MRITCDMETLEIKSHKEFMGVQLGTKVKSVQISLRANLDMSTLI